MKIRQPKDIFGNEVLPGDRIVYILGNHGYTILSWAEVISITWKQQAYRDSETFSMKVRKYGEKGGWCEWKDREKTIFLTHPTCLIVGKGIEDYK
jgi:hypothetical protein